MTTSEMPQDSVVARIIDELTQNPQYREPVLRAILTDRFLELPERVDQLAENVSQLFSALRELTDVLNQFIASTNTRLAALEAGQAELRTDVKALQVGQAELRVDVKALQVGQAELRADVKALQVGQEELRTDVKALQVGQEELRTGQAELRAGQEALRADFKSKIEGEWYERITLTRIKEDIANTVGLRRPQILRSIKSDLDQSLDDAIEAAHDDDKLTAEQVARIARTDLIFTGRRRNPPGIVYAAAETSVTIHQTDITRARSSAAAIATATGNETIAVVVGTQISDRDRAFAVAQNVTVVICDPEQ